MKKHKYALQGILAASAMLLIILDTKSALIGAKDGIQLCIQAVIPSLFPFCVLSGIVNSSIYGKSISLLRPIGRICRIPKGSESLLLLGFIAGYPMGAQLIAQTYKDGKLSNSDAKRMLGFCNNAGPAFLFGMLSPMFRNTGVLWALWGIHIISAIIVGCVIPGEPQSNCKIEKANTVTLTQLLERTIKIMSMVCGWVILFRIIISFCSKWFFWIFPVPIQVLFSGLLEMSNGCVILQKLPTEGFRFVMASLFLAIGGICVSMQTMSVIQMLDNSYYFPGKVLQALLSILFSNIIQIFILPQEEILYLPISINILLVFTTIFHLYILRRKKDVAINKKIMYNTRKESTKGALICCFAKK